MAIALEERTGSVSKKS